MVFLECSVQSCANNSCNHCSLNEITISSTNTYESKGITCENFINKYKVLTNSINKSNPYTHINCRAKHCIYNTNFKCIAYSIDVSSYTSKKIEDTQCSSFFYRTT
ncbi:DUF1540 domain-containing protein [Clostridium sp.]|uniref:DUF1540 domain-containing protein n=1 Tax=Clostridium sp. TaxID=1506 RepID=UPI003216F287